MGLTVSERLDALFSEAEAERRCLARPESAASHRAILRRIPSEISSPIPGLYARNDHWNALDRTQRALHVARALAKLHPSWVFCGPTAAAAWNLETPHTLLGQTYVAGTHRSAASTPHVKRLFTVVETVSLMEGIPTCDPETAAIDCCRIATFPEGLAVMDSLLRSFDEDPRRLAELIDARFAKRRGVARARKALRFADGNSENGGESFARGVMVEEGFLPPRLQVEIPDPVEPGRMYRVDYLWETDGGVIAGELDGRDKLADPALRKGKSMADVLRDERTRESRLTATGAKVLRFSFKDALDRKRFVRTLEAFGVPRCR